MIQIAGNSFQARSWTTRCCAAGDIPNFAFSTHNVPSTSNPFGVKGAGEAGAVGAPPAVINAVVDALHHRAGVRHIDMPADAAPRVGGA